MQVAEGVVLSGRRKKKKQKNELRHETLHPDPILLMYEIFKRFSIREFGSPRSPNPMLKCWGPRAKVL